MIIGEFGTRHFDFMIVAETEEELIEEARSAWQRHCQVYQDADINLIDEYIDEMNTVCVEGGSCAFRDGERI
jgi:hypothetical protein